MSRGHGSSHSLRRSATSKPSNSSSDDPLAAFAFIEAEKAHHAVTTRCRVLGVSRSGYDAWRDRPPCARSAGDQALDVQIRAMHMASRGTDGTPRVHAALRATGRRCGHKRVARLLRGAGLHGCHRRKGTITTRRGADAVPAEDRVRRDCTAVAPNRLWVADLLGNDTTKTLEVTVGT